MGIYLQSDNNKSIFISLSAQVTASNRRLIQLNGAVISEVPKLIFFHELGEMNSTPIFVSSTHSKFENSKHAIFFSLENTTH
jgi:hypothetical protein